MNIKVNALFFALLFSCQHSSYMATLNGYIARPNERPLLLQSLNIEDLQPPLDNVRHARQQSRCHQNGVPTCLAFAIGIGLIGSMALVAIYLEEQDSCTSLDHTFEPNDCIGVDISGCGSCSHTMTSNPQCGPQKINNTQDIISSLKSNVEDTCRDNATYCIRNAPCVMCNADSLKNFIEQIQNECRVVPKKTGSKAKQPKKQFNTAKVLTRLNKLKSKRGQKQRFHKRY
jgi:hypothetical protein